MTSRLKLVAIVQFVGVALCIPALILPDFLPSWSITASLIGLAVVPAFGLIVARRPFARTPVDLPLGLLLIATGANLLATANRAVTLPHVLKTLAGIALFYAIVGLLRETGWTRLAGWAVCLLGLSAGSARALWRAVERHEVLVVAVGAGRRRAAALPPFLEA